MSLTMMDDKPLVPPSAEPESPVLADDAILAAPSSSPAPLPPSTSSPVPGPQRESPLRNVFLGSRGIYPGTRWLIYLAMAFVLFEVEAWLITSFRSHMSDLWWRLIIEVSMMLAAVLPSFVMSRIDDRPFSDFGLPPRRAFRRNFWVGSLWGIVLLSILMLALRVAGAFELRRAFPTDRVV
jgi:hypothetical protein